MAKTRRELSKEIYRFVEDRYFENGEPIIQQDIVKHFVNKYHIGATTVNRCLEELINSKSPFSLKTFYDKNRYYAPPTISGFWKGCMIISISIILLCVVIDVVQATTLFLLTPLAICIGIGFWSGVMIHLRHSKKQNEQ